MRRLLPHAWKAGEQLHEVTNLGAHSLDDSRDLHAPGYLVELGLHLLVGLFEPLVYRGAHAVQEKLGVFGLQGTLFYLDALQATAQRKGDFYLAAQAFGSQFAIPELTLRLINLALHARCLAHKLVHSAAELHTVTSSLSFGVRQPDITQLRTEHPKGFLYDGVLLHRGAGSR